METHCLQRHPHLQAKGHVSLKRSENVFDSLRGKRGKGCAQRVSIRSARSHTHTLRTSKSFVVQRYTVYFVLCEVDCDPHRGHVAGQHPRFHVLVVTAVI